MTWDFPWPVRPGLGEDPTEKDDPPKLTPSGDYILYHGTASSLARKILDERRILHDDWKMVGVTTTPSEAWSYGQMKAMDLREENPEEEPVVLRVILDKDWFTSQEIQREVGGRGINTWLINVVEVPSSAIKDIQVQRSLH